VVSNVSWLSMPRLRHSVGALHTGAGRDTLLTALGQAFSRLERLFRLVLAL